MLKTTMTALALSVLTVPMALAHDFVLGDLMIEHPMSFATATTARTGAGYMIITNNGEADDRLLEARADFPRVEIHEVVEQNDVMSMQQLEAGLAIPAGGTVTLEPGGYHIMLMGLPAPFEVGDEIPITLVFETAGEIEVVFNVEAREGADEMDHSEMNHDGTEEASE